MKTIYSIIAAILLAFCTTPANAADSSKAVTARNDRPCCCRGIGNVIDRFHKDDDVGATAKKVSQDERPCCCRKIGSIVDKFHKGNSELKTAANAAEDKRPCCCMSIANVIDRANETKVKETVAQDVKSKKTIAYQSQSTKE